MNSSHANFSPFAFLHPEVTTDWDPEFGLAFSRLKMMPTLVKIPDHANFGSYKNVKYYPYIIIITSTSCNRCLTWSLFLANWIQDCDRSGCLKGKKEQGVLFIGNNENNKNVLFIIRKIAHGTCSQKFPSSAFLSSHGFQSAFIPSHPPHCNR